MTPAASSHQAVRDTLLQQIRTAGLERDYQPDRHEAGHVLQVAVQGVFPGERSSVRLRLERFIGGGFAGQVYQARLESLDEGATPVRGLVVGQTYAVKVLLPPSGFSVLFRNLLYRVAYQGAFSAQVDPAAVRAGALWQTFLRRGAAMAFGEPGAVVENYGHFFDAELRSWAEISEWVPGRTWQLEIDDSVLTRWRQGAQGWDGPRAGGNSPEYLNKRWFMAKLVSLFHAMGAPELARQYEWWSVKSQPNALKRLNAGAGPADGLTAIDFRAGLALLFCLPMSPVDIWLALRGLLHGKLVQFDRGDVSKLRAYVEARREDFADLLPLLDDLEAQDAAYRRGLPDISHHHVRLLTDSALRREVCLGRIRDWEVLGQVDAPHAERLRASGWLFFWVLLLGLFPLAGRVVRRLWGDARWRTHLGRCLSSLSYLGKTMRVHRAEKVVRWHRKERISDEQAQRLPDRPLRYWLQVLLLSWTPAGVHRLFTQPAHLWNRLVTAVTYPLKLYFIEEFRVQWLHDQVRQAKEEGMLDPEEEQRILASIDDPFIQTYLKCVAVHACTLPVTQVVALIIAAYYYLVHATSWQDGLVTAGLILAFFQGTPISPGSLTRGFYVVYRMIRDRNVKDYWVAALISFWHYVGYLGFPIQMVYRFPGLARFMGGTWATRAARIIPVFGEKGALVEHMVFDLFFNVPISLKALLFGRSGEKVR